MERKLIFDEKNLALFADRLKALRKEKGITQEELAHRAGLTLSQVARIETVRINATLSTVFALARALEIRASALLDFDLENT